VTAHERQVLPLVHFAAVANFKDEDQQYLLLARTENAVIADTILPKLMKLSLEALADAAVGRPVSPPVPAETSEFGVR
jgi:hypothetical protein